MPTSSIQRLRDIWTALPITYDAEPSPSAPPTTCSTLLVHGPGWRGTDDALSFDYDCLVWQLLLRLAGTDSDGDCGKRVEQAWCNRPDASSTGALPVLVSPRGTCLSGEQIAVFLREVTGVGSRQTPAPLEKDSPETTTREKAPVVIVETDAASIIAADVRALVSLFTQRLRPAILFYLWVDPDNYAKAAYPMYGQEYDSNVLRMLAVSSQRSRRQSELRTLVDGEFILRDQIYSKAAEVLDKVQAMLIGASQEPAADASPDTLPWLLRTPAPTEADAILFASLHTALAAHPVAQPDLRAMVKSRRVLVAYAKKAHAFFAE